MTSALMAGVSGLVRTREKFLEGGRRIQPDRTPVQALGEFSDAPYAEGRAPAGDADGAKTLRPCTIGVLPERECARGARLHAQPAMTREASVIFDSVVITRRPSAPEALAEQPQQDSRVAPCRDCRRGRGLDVPVSTSTRLIAMLTARAAALASTGIRLSPSA
jgi:hypothetical protein